jgi:type IV fimbrial biogenesis protein FimT
MKKLRTYRPVSSVSQNGFTLIELLIVLAVMAILMPMGISKLNATLISLKLTAASNTLVSHFHLARSEAIKRNGRVVLCKSDAGVACSATGGWEQGWIVFDDLNGNGQREERETVLAREARLSADIRLTGNMNVARYVSFAPNGATKLADGGFQAGTLTICKVSMEASEARQVVLNAVGRTRVQRTVVPFCT